MRILSIVFVFTPKAMNIININKGRIIPAKNIAILPENPDGS
jgi:hypothetical protein